MKKRNNRKKRIIMDRVVPIAEASRDFDIEFWKRVGAAGRFSATWDLIKDFYRMRGINGNKLRLQRHIQNIQQA